MTDSQKKIFIIGGILIGLVLAVGLFLFFYHPAGKTTSPTPTSTKTTAEQAPIIVESNTAPAPAPAAQAAAKPAVSQDEFYVQQLARIFTERFFSFSNQNQNQHITDALALASPSMASWIQKQTLAQSSEYQGVNTTVVATSVKTLDNGAATVMVDVQRVFGGKEVKKEYKVGRVELVKANEIWKIKGFYWEK